MPLKRKARPKPTKECAERYPTHRDGACVLARISGTGRAQISDHSRQCPRVGNGSLNPNQSRISTRLCGPGPIKGADCSASALTAPGLSSSSSRLTQLTIAHDRKDGTWRITRTLARIHGLNRNRAV